MRQKFETGRQGARGGVSVAGGGGRICGGKRGKTGENYPKEKGR